MRAMGLAGVRRGDPVGRRPLQGGLAVGALALHAVDRIDQVLRDRIDVAGAGRIGRVGGRFRIRQRALATGEGVPATAHRRFVVAEVALLVAAAQGDAELAVGEGVAEDSRYLAGEVVALHRSEEHTSELQSLMRISYAVFWLKKKKTRNTYSAIKITTPEIDSMRHERQYTSPHA